MTSNTDIPVLLIFCCCVSYDV